MRGVDVEQKTEYDEPGFYPFASVFGVFGGNFGASWGVPFGGPMPRESNEYTSETTLYDVTKNQVVWTGTLKSSEPIQSVFVWPKLLAASFIVGAFCLLLLERRRGERLATSRMLIAARLSALECQCQFWHWHRDMSRYFPL